VRKGDRVAVCLGSNWENAVMSYAVWKLGGVLVSSVVTFVFGIREAEGRSETDIQ
jgi:acyl-coenzyme A synthetase/AMP-(fatty) acid ligase